jgi:hypothetical protein
MNEQYKESRIQKKKNIHNIQRMSKKIPFYFRKIIGLYGKKEIFLINFFNLFLFLLRKNILQTK